jgi:hypothetical protein
MNSPLNFIPINTRNAPYRLMLRARWRAFKHTFPFRKGHRIWRVYSHFGLKTHRIFCECGREFK